MYPPKLPPLLQLMLLPPPGATLGLVQLWDWCNFGKVINLPVFLSSQRHKKRT
jgi:hypothetical protein